MTAQDKRFIMNTVKALMRNKNAPHFILPVDPVAYNIPDYFDIIKKPMDLSTVQTKLKNDEYRTKEECYADIQLIFDNCYLYNNAGDPVYNAGKALEEAFKKALKKAPVMTQKTTSINTENGMEKSVKSLPSPPSLPPTVPETHTIISIPTTVNAMPEDQFKRCETLVKELKKQKYRQFSWPFERPVDASAWNATDYYDIIKHPMDMSTYEKKLYDYEYTHEDQLRDDIRLMFKNCYQYNPAEHDVHKLGRKFEKAFEKVWDKLHDGTKHKTDKQKTEYKHVHTDTVTHNYPITTKSENTYKDIDNNVDIKEGIDTATIPSNAKTVTNGTHTATNASNGIASNGINTSHGKSTANTASNGILPMSNGITATIGNQNNGKSTILRLKLSVKQKEADTPTPTPRLTNSIKIPTSSLGNEPPTAPTLAITARPPSPTPHKIAEKKSPTLLPNHDKWFQHATRSDIPDRTKTTQIKHTKPKDMRICDTRPREGITGDTHKDITLNKKDPVAHLPSIREGHTINRETIRHREPVAKPKDQIKPFDIKDIYDKMNNEKRLREQQAREEQEKRERMEKFRREKERQAREDMLEKQREFSRHMHSRRERDRAERMARLHADPIDISKQKMEFQRYESSVMVRDSDWRDLFTWQRDTVDYRHLPVPGFVRRSPIKLSELRKRLLSKCVRLEHSKVKSTVTQNNDEGSDMDVE
ncbi:Bromodomain-containing protein [Pilobolus umbonatus]|nr:Bromodomain-containing protein [Pilobolus umbonatus]